MANVHNVDGEIPLYRVLNEKGFFADDDTMYPTGSEISYTGCPNLEMEPLNAAARARMDDFLEELDTQARIAALANGRAFSGRLTDMGDIIAQAQVDAKRARARGDLVAPAHNPDRVERPDQVPLQHRRKKNAQLKGAKAPAAPKRNDVHALGDNASGDMERAV